MSLPVQFPRWGDAMRKALGIKGRSPSLSLLEDIMPVYEIGATEEPDQHYLKGEFLGDGYILVAALAGNYSGAAIVNPPDSGVLITVETVVVRCATASVLNLFNGPIGNLTSFTGLCCSRDSRNALNTGEMKNGRARMGFRQGVFISPTNTLQIGPSDYRTWEGPWIIQPNWFLLASAGVVNTAIDMTVTYQERTLMPEDLQG